jgi:hypothetical protein
MQFEISTAEAAEIFSVTKKTVCEWGKLGIFEKIAHGKYDLKKSLEKMFRISAAFSSASTTRSIFG